MVPKAAPTGAGVVQGVSTNPFPIHPKYINTYPEIALITGTKRKGIIIIGFKTNGVPKISGSLMLNNEGTIDSFPNCFIWTDLALSIRIANAKVDPPPPIAII